MKSTIEELEKQLALAKQTELTENITKWHDENEASLKLLVGKNLMHIRETYYGTYIEIKKIKSYKKNVNNNGYHSNSIDITMEYVITIDIPFKNKKDNIPDSNKSTIKNGAYQYKPSDFKIIKSTLKGSFPKVHLESTVNIALPAVRGEHGYYYLDTSKMFNCVSAMFYYSYEAPEEFVKEVLNLYQETSVKTANLYSKYNNIFKDLKKINIS